MYDLGQWEAAGEKWKGAYAHPVTLWSRSRDLHHGAYRHDLMRVTFHHPDEQESGPRCPTIDCAWGCIRTSLGIKNPDEVLSPKAAKVQATKDVSDHLGAAVNEIHQMMLDRHRKYGAGNIAKHGPTGIHVRMDDKFARLDAGFENHDDETIGNTLDDIIGYALIWKLWIKGQWPGSELDNRTTKES